MTCSGPNPRRPDVDTLMILPPLPIAELQAEIDASNQALGWRETVLTFDECMAMAHSEVSEALEAWREWGLADATTLTSHQTDEGGWVGPYVKPEGVGSEFGDLAIRLLDDCYLFGIDLEAELAAHPGRYSWSDSFVENINHLHVLIAIASLQHQEGDEVGHEVAGAFVFLQQLCSLYGFDLEAEMRRKMAYNKTRPYRHGGKRI
jgi:NTP pyrophosphatase (non-canonical NTP hydrolase)